MFRKREKLLCVCNNKNLIYIHTDSQINSLSLDTTFNYIYIKTKYPFNTDPKRKKNESR